MRQAARYYKDVLAGMLTKSDTKDYIKIFPDYSSHLPCLLVIKSIWRSISFLTTKKRNI